MESRKWMENTEFAEKIQFKGGKKMIFNLNF